MKRFKFSNLCLPFFFAAISACSVQPSTSETKFESAHSVAVEAEIIEGSIIATTSNEVAIQRQIREQLMYTIGQMNGRNGGVDMNRLDSEVLNVEERQDGLFNVTYKADLFVSWQRNRALPENILFIVPARGDFSGLNTFFNKYGSDENTGKKCLASEAHDVGQSLLWYYYRPEKFNCSLKTDSGASDVEVVKYLKADLKLSGENTTGKSPEYDKVWEDNKLVITAIFGKATHGATANSDAGIAAYRRMYRLLRQKLGNPKSSNLKFFQQPNNKNDVVELTFDTAKGTLDIHLYLIEDIKTVAPEFRAKYNERTLTSDFVSYNGHAGLGANIRALAKMGQFSKDQWQLFLVNGCDTFAYVDDSLRKAHQNANPDFGPDKFVDVITNAMPAFFHALAQDNWAVIEGLLEGEKSYREILKGFDSYQRAAVTGEQDNNWPLDF